ncbi:retrotransposon protein, putative, ty1-copia subclass [Tanacetum coccineum]
MMMPCHTLQEVGHWKRNYLAYLAELIKKKQVALPRLQGLRGERKLKQGAIYLYVGNDVREQVEAIGSFDLVLPNGIVICLDNCHYAPTITRDVVLVSVDNSFIQCFTDYGISVSKNDVLYFNAIPYHEGEYISQEFKDYLKSYGIVQQLTPSYTPQHNGVSERRNHTLLDMVRSTMNLTILPLSFWDYALESATRILNKVSTKKVDNTPYELWYGKFPNLSYLKVCGCEALVKRDTPDKLQRRSVKSVRTHRAPNHLCLNVEVEEHSLGDLNEPTNYKSAMLDLESDKWLDAMNAEMQSMKDNQVWCLVNLPPNGKTIESKWLFKKTTDMDGIVHTYKARLVAKGFTQTYEVDYEDTFSPVTDIRAIRILIAITAFYGHEIWKMDVKTSFLNGYLGEDIYMVQPEGFVDPNYPRKNPGEPHWTAVKTILKYLRYTKDMLLVYGGNPEAELRVDCYRDVRFETDRDDIKSQT